MERSPYPPEEVPPTFASPLPPSVSGVRTSAMELPGAGTRAVEEAAGDWDWDSLLGFTIEDDDPFIMSWEQEERPLPAPPPSADPIPQPPLREPSPGSSIQASTTTTASRPAGGAPSRVRKRDPRLTCENFLAGRVPCSCPEEDEKDEDEEEAVGPVSGGGRKKVRAGGVVTIARCQVPGCGADIRELKGYHRRHRVCLRCANASSVFLDGESKRYCQQCGKFHILSDFDEGKRSCRRKLERHNKRRRRRLVDHNEKEPLGNLLADAAYEEEPSKANVELSNEITCGVDGLFVGNGAIDAETSLEPDDGQGETQMAERNDNIQSTISSSFCENKNAYSSMCPTGRVSFKLYDWNPADFPRRLRHQIFQWLASMPVELEGYIRPGCTILTLFIAMPQFMWDKLSNESAVSVNSLVKAPQSLFLGKGEILIYLNNKIFQLMKDGTLLANIKMEVQVPRLHYVHPNCFEAGKPMEFLACGSNLVHHKFRFLVSFAGRYLDNEFCGVVSHGTIKSFNEIGDDFQSSEHQILMIRILNTEPGIFGPAFVEVENECGISNFIPILFGDQNVCTETKRLRRSINDAPCSDIVSQTADAGAIPHLCKHLVSSQTSISDLFLDIAWLLKEPKLNKNEMFSNSFHIQRLNCLLKHLLQNESFSILEKILHYLDVLMEGRDLREFTSIICDTQVRLFLNDVSNARKFLHQKGQANGKPELDSENSNDKGSSGEDSDLKAHALRFIDSVYQNHEAKMIDRQAVTNHVSKDCEEEVAFLNKDAVHRTDCYPHLSSKWQNKSWFHIFSRRITSTRLAVLIMFSVVVCCGICVALLHPHEAGDFVVTVRRCLFGGRQT
uniref:Squamosa promoter-binding-like protein 9 n=1 Tax=Anthurium amnicola TaxID=1678845 RepID=A0A1D1YJZ3_9ARAE